MKRNLRVLLSSILLVVFAFSMVATVYSNSYAGYPRLYVCCTKVLSNGTVIEGVKRYGMPDATCSYDLCVEVGEFCNCSISR